MNYELPITVREIVDYMVFSLGRQDIPRNQIAVNIVCATLANNSINIEDLYEQYPELNSIVEIACDLEIKNEDEAYRDELWRKMCMKVERLNVRLETIMDNAK